MKILLTLVFILCSSLSANAMLQTLAIEVTEANGKIFVSIYSDDERERRKDISVEEATKMIAQLKPGISGYMVGIVDRGIPAWNYLPVIKAVAENSALALNFIEAGDPKFNEIIKRRIKPVFPATPPQH